MDDLREYFARYEALAAISADMLARAQRNDMKGLATLRVDYLGALEALREVTPERALSPAERERKYDIIAKILKEDAAIRDLCEPSIARLARYFSRRPVEALRRLCALR